MSRFQIPLVPGLSSTIHVAQGTEMFPIIKLDETITPTHVFVAMTRSRRSSRCLIEPSDNFDFSVFGKGTPLNPKNELLLEVLVASDVIDHPVLLRSVGRRQMSPARLGASIWGSYLVLVFILTISPVPFTPSRASECLTTQGAPECPKDDQTRQNTRSPRHFPVNACA